MHLSIWRPTGTERFGRGQSLSLLDMANRSGTSSPPLCGIAEMKRLIKSIFQAFGHDIIKVGRSKISKPVVEVDVEILDDPVFQASVKEVSGITLLDTARLANLWRSAGSAIRRERLSRSAPIKGAWGFIFRTPARTARFTYATRLKDSATS